MTGQSHKQTRTGLKVRDMDVYVIRGEAASWEDQEEQVFHEASVQDPGFAEEITRIRNETLFESVPRLAEVLGITGPHQMK